MVRAIILVLGVGMVLVGCQTDRLTDLNELAVAQVLPTTANISFCTQDASTVKSKLKFTFMIDESGSNQTLLADLGTDPDGTRRYNAILNFLAQAPDDDNIEYALIKFSTGASIPYTGAFLTKNAFKTAVLAEKYELGCSQAVNAGCPNDGGWTNYTSALNLANTIIGNDIAAAKANTKEIVSTYYVNFFVSDGAPIIGGTPGSYISQSQTDITTTIGTLTNLKNGDNKAYVEAIQLHTLFYYNNVSDPAATSLLSTMATTGNGDYVQVSDGQSIDFSKFTVPTRQVKHAFRDLFIENIRGTWWEGAFMKDSDGDGIPDAIELTLGSDPTNADSDGNGVNDLVEYRALGKVCKAENCLPSGSESFETCKDLEQHLAGQPKYGDLDKDGLNDCEEKLLGSDKTDWDSNQDWIADGLEFRSGMAFVSSSVDRETDPDGDGLTNYQELKNMSPVLYPNQQIHLLLTPIYVLKKVSDSAIKTCYNLKVTNMPRLSDQDVFKVHLYENTSIIDNKKFQRTATVALTNQQLVVNQGDFQ